MVVFVFPSADSERATERPLTRLIAISISFSPLMHEWAEEAETDIFHANTFAPSWNRDELEAGPHEAGSVGHPFCLAMRKIRASEKVTLWKLCI